VPVQATNQEWTALDDRAVDTARVLAMDAVEAAGNGHPGTAMALAPAAYLLFQQLLRHDPRDPGWIGRDRFILSCGHSSLTLYIQLYLSGYPVTLEDLQRFRSWGSMTPGHPEYRHTPGVEITTGPLGQGLATSVGFAMAARRSRDLLDPQAPVGASPFDHTIWVFASDGDLQEGVTAEAASLAGRLGLHNLVVLYDDNDITIEGATSLSMNEDVLARYAAYGWHTQRVSDIGDIAALRAALTAARDADRPAIVAVNSVIAFPAPSAQNTAASHGSALGSAEVAATKEILGFAATDAFAVEPEVLAHTRRVTERSAVMRAGWEDELASWRQREPERAGLLDRLIARQLPDGWQQAIAQFEPGGSVATRSASGKVINSLGDLLPELWGGSADLAGSNNTTISGAGSFLPETPGGRNIHFGIREHAMGAALNGIALHGLTRPYGGTFLVFSDYMRPAVRLAAMMRLPVTYVWTHDSIGLGEDGPTHQPVEHLAALRAIPGLAVARPADAGETADLWAALLLRDDGPTALCLTRQNVPVLQRPAAAADGVARGGYVLADTDGRPDVLLLATGSEVQIALDARDLLAADGIAARVVSLPCLEWFAEQDAAYRESVLPAGVTARVSVEAGIAMPWAPLVGSAGRSVSLEHFGASAPYERLYEEFGITAAAVAAAARDCLSGSTD
jgi:transketolase